MGTVEGCGKGLGKGCPNRPEEVEEAAEVYRHYDRQDAAEGAPDARANLGAEQLRPHDEGVQAESQASRGRREEGVIVRVVPADPRGLLLRLLDWPDLNAQETFPHLLQHDRGGLFTTTLRMTYLEIL